MATSTSSLPFASLLTSCTSIIVTSLSCHTYRTSSNTTSTHSTSSKSKPKSKNSKSSSKTKNIDPDTDEVNEENKEKEEHAEKYTEAVQREVQTRAWLEAVKAEYVLALSRANANANAHVKGVNISARKDGEEDGGHETVSSLSSATPHPPQQQKQQRTETEILNSITHLKSQLYELTVEDQNKILFLTRLGRGAADGGGRKDTGNENKSESEPIKSKNQKQIALANLIQTKRLERDALACTAAALAIQLREVREVLKRKYESVDNERVGIVKRVREEVLVGIDGTESNTETNLQAKQIPSTAVRRTLNKALRDTLSTLIFNCNVKWYEDEKMCWLVMQLENGGKIRGVDT